MFMLNKNEIKDSIFLHKNKSVIRKY